MAQAGTVLGGRYVLDDQMGNGGYGEVWRATDTVLTRPVAVKLPHPRYTQRNDALARFRAEARHAGALSHENIAQVFDYGEPADGEPPYLVMELVDGPSLETVLTGGPLDDSRTMDIVAQAAAGLQAAHAAGMIHRDIKPGNLLLAPGGTVKITDFGIAHTIGSAPLTASGELIGTPGYLAPERAMGEQATPASDLYSLGMLAYECLAGTPPFRGTPLEVALAHRDRPLPPLPPSVGVGVAALVMRLAAKDPACRPNDAAEVAVWAGLLRDGVSVAALHRWPEQPPAAGLFQRRTVLAYACVAVTAVLVIVLASVIGFASTPGPVTAAPAPAPASSSSQGGGSGGGDATAPPARGPAASPGQPPAARSVVKRRPATPNLGVGAAVAVADPAGPGPGHGSGKGHDHGPRAGPGSGHGKVKNEGNGQDDLDRRDGVRNGEIMTRAGSAMSTRRTEPNVLGIYLNDHLAGATAGTELARRAAGSAQDREDHAALRGLAADVAQDRVALLKIMATLGIPVRTYKVYAGWIGEKAGRLKFNGRLFTRSPLSRLEELELLRLGVEGKAAGWRTLRVLADTDQRLEPALLDELIARAGRQADLLEDLRVRAADQVISLETTS